MKEVSRRQFLKGTLAGTAAVAAAGALGITGLSAVAETKSLYTPGTYSAIEKGAMSSVKVTMTFSETAITDVVVDTSGETAGIGLEEGERLAALLKDLQNSMIEGPITLDAKAGATLTRSAVEKAAYKCVQQARGEIPVEVTESAAEEAKAADWLGEAPEVAESDIAQTLSTDFLVVGAGNGGGAGQRALQELTAGYFFHGDFLLENSSRCFCIHNNYKGRSNPQVNTVFGWPNKPCVSYRANLWYNTPCDPQDGKSPFRRAAGGGSGRNTGFIRPPQDGESSLIHAGQSENQTLPHRDLRPKHGCNPRLAQAL